MPAKRKFVDRALQSLGLQRLTASSSGYPAFQGAGLTRLNADWIGSLLSADQEIRTSLKRLRARCRQLHNNNDYAQGFVNLMKQNIVGPNGIQLEAQVPAEGDELSDQVNEEIERGWRVWCRRGNCTVDRRMDFRDVLNLAVETLVVDGEVFIRKVNGFPNNPFRFALQFVDADQIDVTYERARIVDPAGKVLQNEVKMGVELDAWGAPLAYWAYNGHPSEGAARRDRIPAEQMIHAFMFRRGNQTRGIPWMHTAMTRLNMLGGYEEAALVAARLAACKMAVIQSKTGGEYTGARSAQTGAIQTTIEPGVIDQLPADSEMKPIDWNSPNTAMPDFLKAMLHGAAVGLTVSYTSFAGDLREVNFSSIRQGVLAERDVYKALQTFAKAHLCQPVYQAVVPAAIIARQMLLPAGAMDDYVDEDNVRWQARGWTWVDPLKDIQAAIVARGAGIQTLADICSQQGKDWRDQVDQIALEDAYALKKGVKLNFSRPSPSGIGADPEETAVPGGEPVPANQDDGENKP